MNQSPSNTRIWEALGKTDPRHTKKFQRAGGFKGTATRPIWLTLRMTEHFGPCGIGWGPDMPMFTVERSAEEGMVFCTVGLWYIDPECKVRGQVYGVGGDKFIIAQSSGLRTSDEAFKAAYTDAIGNAMKLIGVSADVHMGLFDDSKYVQEVGREFDEAEEKLPPVEAPKTLAEAVLPKLITAAQASAFRETCTNTGWKKEQASAFLKAKGIANSARIPQPEYEACMEWARGESEVAA